MLWRKFGQGKESDKSHFRCGYGDPLWEGTIWTEIWTSEVFCQGLFLCLPFLPSGTHHFSALRVCLAPSAAKEIPKKTKEQHLSFPWSPTVTHNPSTIFTYLYQSGFTRLSLPQNQLFSNSNVFNKHLVLIKQIQIQGSTFKIFDCVDMSPGISLFKHWSGNSDASGRRTKP